MAVKSQDLFMQWYPVRVTLDAADSSALAEAEFTTGLSIRGDYAWIIHRVEMEFPTWLDQTAVVNLQCALSTVNGETVMPEIDSKGVIVRLSQTFVVLVAEAGIILKQPHVWTSLPPTIIATPKLSFYCRTTVDNVPFRGDPIIARIGYTTVPIDDKTYLEIAETFETL